MLPEAGGGVGCSAGGAKPSRRLLEVRGVKLDAWRGVLEGVEEVWELGQILVCERLRCLLWNSWSVVEGRAEG